MPFEVNLSMSTFAFDDTRSIAVLTLTCVFAFLLVVGIIIFVIVTMLLFKSRAKVQAALQMRMVNNELESSQDIIANKNVAYDCIKK